MKKKNMQKSDGAVLWDGVLAHNPRERDVHYIQSTNLRDKNMQSEPSKWHLEK